MIFDWDDMGVNHVISDQCQSHDCRDKLDELHYANPNFKATLFTIPAEMTIELMDWCKANENWIELAVHGWKHTDNWEASKWTYEEADYYLSQVEQMRGFVKGFKAPGWQISDDTYKWLQDNGWWVADQNYNDSRRPTELPAYIHVGEGNFVASPTPFSSNQVEAWHGHTWDCVGNGIYETFDHVKSLVMNANSFQFVSEVL